MRPNLHNQVLFGIVCGIAGGIVALAAERLLAPPPALAQVDLAGLVAEHLRRPGLVELSDKERAEQAGRFAARLEREVGWLSDEYGAVILSAPAVLSGAPDLTPVLRRRLQEDGRDGR